MNPLAGGGRALRRLREIQEALGKYNLKHEIILTKGRGDATELGRGARLDGVDVLAVAGGDGTLNEVVQAYFDEDGKAIPGPDLALLPFGTGDDLRRTLGLPSTVDEAVARIRFGARRALDVGLLRFEADGTANARRVFVNVASFGIGGHVDALVNRAPGWVGSALGGKALFSLATMRAMASYRNAAVRVSVDGAPWFEGKVLNLAIANGRFFGGGMMIAPDADPFDGLFDVTALGDLTTMQGLGMTTKIYKGTHRGRPKVTATRGRVVEAWPLDAHVPVLMDVDGEAVGRLPLHASVAPGAVTFRL